MPSRVLSLHAVTAAAVSILLIGCAQLTASPEGTRDPEPSVPTAASTFRPDPTQPSRSPSPSSAAIAAPSLDLQALRDSLLGSSPVPAEWEAQVDDIIASIEAALRQYAVPQVGGLDPVAAACATWEPLVGRLRWASGAVVERHVMLAHLVQFAGVAPDEIVAAAESAARVVADAAAAQLSPDGEPADISATPKDELWAIGRWALEHCELLPIAEPDPNAGDWTPDEIAQSCDLDRSLLERGQDQFLRGPGNGRYATHPHELEISLDTFVYPAWHQLASVDNDTVPPSFVVEPIAGGFCVR
jgi:hypothetical protein